MSARSYHYSYATKGSKIDFVSPHSFPPFFFMKEKVNLAESGQHTVIIPSVLAIQYPFHAVL